MKKLITCLTLLGLVFVPAFLLPQKALAGQTIINPVLSGDTYVAQGAPSQNFGQIGNLVFNYYNNDLFWTYVKFDVPSIPSNATIDSAYLRLYRQSCEGLPNPTTFTIAEVRGSWQESTLTWSNKPANGVQTTASIACGSPDDYTSYSVKSIVESWKSGNTPNGFAIYGPKNGNWYRTFYAKEGISPAKAAKLTIYYTTPDAPAPAPDSANSSSGSGTSSNGATSTSTPAPTTGSTATTADTTAATPTSDKVADNTDGADLDELARTLSAESGMDWIDRFGIIMIYGAPILGLLFWISLIILIIFLVKRHKKKKAEETKEETEAPEAAAPAEAPEEAEAVKEDLPEEKTTKSK